MSDKQVIKICIADDHQLIIDGIKSLLAGFPNYKIVGEATNGAELITLVERISPDVVIVDIEMPEMNGIEATKSIVKKHPKIKVIVLTMHNEPAIIKQIMDAGAKGYILKNIDSFELIRCIDIVMGGEQYLSSEAFKQLIKTKQNGNLHEASEELTIREKEILKLVAEGYSAAEIAEKLFISSRTVDVHRSNIMRKLNVNNIAGLVRYALQNNLLI